MKRVVNIGSGYSGGCVKSWYGFLIGGAINGGGGVGVGVRARDGARGCALLDILYYFQYLGSHLQKARPTGIIFSNFCTSPWVFFSLIVFLFLSSLMGMSETESKPSWEWL